MKEKNFPQKLKFGVNYSVLFNGLYSIELETVEAPRVDYKRLVYRKVKATWEDQPMYKKDLDLVSDEELLQTFMDVITFKTLPNSMESIQFTFLIRGLPLVEVTHLLRHRTLSGIHAQCTGDRDLREDTYYIPNSIQRLTEDTNDNNFAERYKKLVEQCVELYSDMVDSGDVSLMDARYILPRSAQYFYYFTVNLKDLIMIINQRKCTMIQPEVDNYFAYLLYTEAVKYIPELKEIITLKCTSNCHYVNSRDDLNTRLYYPDKNHEELLRNKGLNEMPNSVYKRTRKDMGSLI